MTPDDAMPRPGPLAPTDRLVRQLRVTQLVAAIALAVALVTTAILIWPRQAAQIPASPQAGRSNHISERRMTSFRPPSDPDERIVWELRKLRKELGPKDTALHRAAEAIGRYEAAQAAQRNKCP